MQDPLTVAEAAKHLEISKEAVRKRISRGTLRAEKDADGTVRVYVPLSSTTSDAEGDLVAAHRRHIEDFREQLAEANTANRENRRIIAALTQRIPQVESPPESQEKGTARAEEDNITSETAAPHSRPSGFLPPLKDKLPLHDYVLAVAVPLTWAVFSQVLLLLLTDSSSVGTSVVYEMAELLANLFPLELLLLLSGFWLGVRRRGGLSLTTLGIIAVPITVVVAVLDAIPEVWYYDHPSILVRFQHELSKLEVYFEGVAASLIAVGGVLLGKAIQQRGLKTGIYGDDPAASGARLQSRRAILNLDSIRELLDEP